MFSIADVSRVFQFLWLAIGMEESSRERAATCENANEKCLWLKVN